MHENETRSDEVLRNILRQQSTNHYLISAIWGNFTKNICNFVILIRSMTR